MSRSENEENRSSYTGEDVDPNALVQSVLREAYMQLTEDLRDHAEKVRYYNQQKKAIRKYLNEIRKLRALVLSKARMQGIDLCRGDEENSQVLAQLLEKHAHSHETGDIEYELCIPERVPPEEVVSVESLDAVLIEWEKRLNTIGEDAQLANLDMQNWLQKQQQVLQMMSNLSKMSHDTMMAIIRNLKS